MTRIQRSKLRESIMSEMEDIVFRCSRLNNEQMALQGLDRSKLVARYDALKEQLERL